MGNKFVERLKKKNNALTQELDPFASVIRTPSPSLNWCFGNTWGLPLGMTLVLWGKPKAGKSLVSNYLTGNVHQQWPEGIVVKFDTEMRDRGQLSRDKASVYGIDRDRYVTYEVNSPDAVFDFITGDIASECEAGADIKMVIIDSITGIKGRREMNRDSIMNQTIGDHALTVQEGLKSILGVQRKYNFSVVLTAHARAEMNLWEIKKGHTTKMQASFGVQHHSEYFLMVDKNDTAAGRSNELGESYADESRKDLKDKAEQTGHKIRCWMQESSVGPKNRTAEFALDYSRGIIETHEEIFRLGLRWGAIQKPNNVTYQIGDSAFRGKKECIEGLRDSTELQQLVLTTLMSMENRIRQDISDEEAVSQLSQAPE